MSNPYRTPAEKPVIRKVQLTEEELKKAILDFIENNCIVDDWRYGDVVEYTFYLKDRSLGDAEIGVEVRKNELINDVKYY